MTEPQRLTYGEKNLDWAASAENFAEFLASLMADELTYQAERFASTAGRRNVIPTDVADGYRKTTERLAAILEMRTALGAVPPQPKPKARRKAK